MICWEVHFGTTPFEATVQLARKLVVRRLRSAWERSDHHHALSGQQGSALAGQMTEPPLHQVPGDRNADGLGHHEAHPWSGEHTWLGALGRPAPAGGPPSVDHRSDGHGGRPLENDWVRSDGFWGRARPAAHASGSEAVATLATAGRQDGAAGAGAHPQTEAVGLVPTAVVRLERALAQRIHSTRGAWLKSPITGWPCGSRHCGQPAPRTNDPVDCRGHAAPVDAGFDLPTVRAGCQQGQFGERPWRAGPRSPDHRRSACSGPTRRCLGILPPVACGQLLIRRRASC